MYAVPLNAVTNGTSNVTCMHTQLYLIVSARYYSILQFVFTVVGLVMEDSFFQVQMSAYMHAGTNVPHSARACCFSRYFSSTYSYCHPNPHACNCGTVSGSLHHW